MGDVVVGHHRIVETQHHVGYGPVGWRPPPHPLEVVDEIIPQVAYCTTHKRGSARGRRGPEGGEGVLQRLERVAAPRQPLPSGKKLHLVALAAKHGRRLTAEV